jgi:hypothetical protein
MSGQETLFFIELLSHLDNSHLSIDLDLIFTLTYHKELDLYTYDNTNSNQKEKLVKQMIPGAVNHTTFSV